MDNTPLPEGLIRTPETLGSKREAIDTLCEKLGFIETDELRTIREQAIDAASLGETERLGALLFEYQAHAEELVSKLQGGDYMKGQIALIIAKATLHRDTGDLGAFLDDIKDAKEYAFDAYEDEAVAVLERAPSVEIAHILGALGEEFGFDDQTVAEIAAEPYDSAYEIAYGYLLQAGLDADELLNAFDGADK